MTADPLYTETQAAVFLGNEDRPFSVRTLQRWRVEGFGPKFIKLGKSVRYRQSELEAFVSNGCCSSTSEIGGKRYG